VGLTGRAPGYWHVAERSISCSAVSAAASGRRDLWPHAPWWLPRGRAVRTYTHTVLNLDLVRIIV
jgi:hypothetical protein